MALSGPAAGFIGASVTLVLVIIFMILMVILVRQCLAFLAKRNHLRAQMEQHQRQREHHQRRRGSITEPVPATFDWHHSIRIAGTPPPSYIEAKKLPSFEDGVEGGEKQEHKVVISKEKEEADETKVESDGEATFVITTSGGSHSTTGATTGQSTSMNGGNANRSHDNQGVSHDQASGNMTVQIDIENNPGEESRTFSTGYTEYGRASS